MAKKINPRLWKKTEKEAADLFDTKRTPFSGSNSGISASDTLHPELFIECKTKGKIATMTLYRDTYLKAREENKIPLLYLKENNSDDTLIVFEKKDLLKILKEIDLNKIDKNIPKGTTLDYLLNTKVPENDNSLYNIKKRINEQIGMIYKEKLLSKENMENLKNFSFLHYCIDLIEEYIRLQNEE